MHYPYRMLQTRQRRQAISTPNWVIIAYFIVGCLAGAPYYYETALGALAIFNGLGALMVLSIALLREDRIPFPRKNSLIILLVCLICWINFSLLLITFDGSFNSAYGFASNVKTFYMIAFVFVGYVMANANFEVLTPFFGGIKWVNVLASFVLLISFWQNGIFVNWDIYMARTVGRATVSLWPTQFAILASLGALIAFCDALSARGWRKYLEIGLIVLFLIMLALTLTRSGWIAFMVATLTLWLSMMNTTFSSQFKLNRSVIFILVLAFVAIWGVFQLYPRFLESLVRRVLEAQNVGEGGAIDDRFEYWGIFLEYIQRRPLSGYGGIGVAYIANIGSAHSEYFDQVIRYGIVGSFLFLLILLLHGWSSFWTVRRLLTQQKLFPQLRHLLLFAPLVTFSLTFGSGQYSIRDPLLGNLVFLTIGYLMGFQRRYSHKTMMLIPNTFANSGLRHQRTEPT